MQPEPEPNYDVYFGPTITVTEPARAAMLEQGNLETSFVNVSGDVCDSLQTITNFTFNDNPMTLVGTRPDEPFTAQVASPWGLTIMHGTILNDIGWQGHLAHSFLRSPEFFPPATQDNPAARVTSAVVTQLGQDIIDDGDREDFDDIATIAAYAMMHMKSSWFPNDPIYEGSKVGITFKIYLDDIYIEDLDLTMDLIDGGIHTEVDITDATIELR